MIKYNHNFVKPDADMRPLYGPMPLGVEIPHHGEWDEPVLDPETGEPTGETEHQTHDWTEKRTVIHPTAADFALMGYLPISSDAPVDPAPDGQHWERTDKIEPNGDDGYKWVYTLVDNPPPPPRRWTRFSIKGALADAHLLPAAKAFLGAYELKPNYTALEAFTDVDYIEEFYGGEETWNTLLNGAAQALGKTRADIDAFLDAIPTEG